MQNQCLSLKNLFFLNRFVLLWNLRSYSSPKDSILAGTTCEKMTDLNPSLLLAPEIPKPELQRPALGWGIKLQPLVPSLPPQAEVASTGPPQAEVASTGLPEVQVPSTGPANEKLPSNEIVSDLKDAAAVASASTEAKPTLDPIVAVEAAAASATDTKSELPGSVTVTAASDTKFELAAPVAVAAAFDTNIPTHVAIAEAAPIHKEKGIVKIPKTVEESSSLEQIPKTLEAEQTPRCAPSSDQAPRSALSSDQTSPAQVCSTDPKEQSSGPPKQESSGPAPIHNEKGIECFGPAPIHNEQGIECFAPPIHNEKGIESRVLPSQNIPPVKEATEQTAAAANEEVLMPKKDQTKGSMVSLNEESVAGASGPVQVPLPASRLEQNPLLQNAPPPEEQNAKAVDVANENVVLSNTDNKSDTKIGTKATNVESSGPLETVPVPVPIPDVKCLKIPVDPHNTVRVDQLESPTSPNLFNQTITNLTEAFRDLAAAIKTSIAVDAKAVFFAETVAADAKASKYEPSIALPAIDEKTTSDAAPVVVVDKAIETVKIDDPIKETKAIEMIKETKANDTVNADVTTKASQDLTKPTQAASSVGSVDPTPRSVSTTRPLDLFNPAGRSPSYSKLHNPAGPSPSHFKFPEPVSMLTSRLDLQSETKSAAPAATAAAIQTNFDSDKLYMRNNSSENNVDPQPKKETKDAKAAATAAPGATAATATGAAPRAATAAPGATATVAGGATGAAAAAKGLAEWRESGDWSIYSNEDGHEEIRINEATGEIIKKDVWRWVSLNLLS